MLPDVLDDSEFLRKLMITVIDREYCNFDNRYQCLIYFYQCIVSDNLLLTEFG